MKAKEKSLLVSNLKRYREQGGNTHRKWNDLNRVRPDSNGHKHCMKQLEVALDLLRNEHHFMIEAQVDNEHLDIHRRIDVLGISPKEITVYEVQDHESDKSIEEKRRDFERLGFEFIVFKVV